MYDLQSSTAFLSKEKDKRFHPIFLIICKSILIVTFWSSSNSLFEGLLWTQCSRIVSKNCLLLLNTVLFQYLEGLHKNHMWLNLHKFLSFVSYCIKSHRPSDSKILYGRCLIYLNKFLSYIFIILKVNCRSRRSWRWRPNDAEPIASSFRNQAWKTNSLKG